MAGRALFARTLLTSGQRLAWVGNSRKLRTERMTWWETTIREVRPAPAVGDRTDQPFLSRQDLRFRLIHDQKTIPESPIRTETFYAYAPGAGALFRADSLPIIDGRPAEELKNVGAHSHNDFDEVYYFFGTDCIDNTRLGGQVEMWLGHGEDAEKFVMSDPAAVYVPKGLAHNPWIVTKVNDPNHPS